MKAVHKIWRPMVAGTAILGLVATVAIAARPNPTTVSVKARSDGAGPATAAVAAGLNYSFGFEAGEGFALGYIGQGVNPAGCGGAANPCWGRTTAGSASLVEGHIDSVHPATGTQHLRLSHDPTTRTNMTGFGLGVDARFPWSGDLSVRPVAANTTTADVAIDTPFGMDYRFQPQSNSQGFLQTSILFYYDGGLFVLDDHCGVDANSGFWDTGFDWDSSGAYQNVTIVHNPCTDHVDYYYGGQLIWTGCAFAGTNLEQFLVFGDNYPGSSMDVDNVVLRSDEACPSVCGNGVREGVEQCDVGIDCQAGHTCDMQTCQCSRICTLDAPCILHNGVNGPFTGPFDAAYGGIFLYDAGPVEAVSVELCGSSGIDTFIQYWGSWNDIADPGVSNDDCCDAASPACGTFGVGSDPSASCYNDVTPGIYESCACHDLPLAGDSVYVLQTNGGNDLDVQMLVTISKKATCGGGHLGACCDTNGVDAGRCIDGVLQADCSAAGFAWSEYGKCADIQCTCIPLCAGRVCGDDGCGGSCGDCNDHNACNGVETCNQAGQCDPGTPVVCDDNNACNGVETCNPADGSCIAGTPLACDDQNACNGVETCAPASGCVPGTPLVCSDNNVCNGVETCNPSSGCVNGTPLNCNNGQFCDGDETCNPTSGCVPGTPPNCDDSRDCTVDSCNEDTNACDHDDADCSIPTVSEWGLVILTLLLLTGAKVYFGRRQAIA